jgi:hypothetical protein
MKTKEELWKMPIKDLEKTVTGAFPTSDTWNVAWPVYEVRRRRTEAWRTWICFGVSTAIPLAALVRTFISK